MRIVEYGYIKPKEVKCDHCGAILEYVSRDLTWCKDDRYTLECPICREKIYTDNDGQFLSIKDN